MLAALASDGGVGRDRATVAPGSVAFGDGGTTFDERDLPVGSVLVPGAGASAAVGDRGSFGRHARQLPVEPVRDLGAVSGERARGLLGPAVDAWCDERVRGLLGSAVDAWYAARASVVCLVSSTGSANLDQIASVGSSLLRLCHGSGPNDRRSWVCTSRLPYSPGWCSPLVWYRQEISRNRFFASRGTAGRSGVRRVLRGLDR